jgi:hypothetical protein
MKTCRKCKERKNESEFYIMKTKITLKNGKTKIYHYFRPYCKICWHKIREKGNRGAQSQRYRDKYIKKNRAQQLVYLNIKKGRLIKPKICSDCGHKNKYIHAHHPNYNQPLDIIWLCWECHNYIHQNSKHFRR